MTVGRTYAPEWRDYLDTLTGRRVRELTNSPTRDDHLYFYNPSVMSDGGQAILASNRIGARDITLTNWDGKL